MIRHLRTLYGLKWNPFLSDAPLEGLLANAAVEHFAWRIEQMGAEGGFALVTGDPGTGKSVVLRFVVATTLFGARPAGGGARSSAFARRRLLS
ncbi:MAG: hypothetical protein U0587_08175 [Candidatus Binatia bacterium]